MTCVVHVNHNMLSEVDDAYFVADSIDEVLSAAIERNTDADVSFTDMSLADARARIHRGLEQPLFAVESDWPDPANWSGIGESPSLVGTGGSVVADARCSRRGWRRWWFECWWWASLVGWGALRFDAGGYG